MAMMRYVNATIRKVAKPDVKEIVICRDSGLVEEDPTNDEPEEDDERDSDGKPRHKTFDRAD